MERIPKLKVGDVINSILDWKVTEVPEYDNDWTEFTAKIDDIEVCIQYHNKVALYSTQYDLIHRGTITCKGLKDGINKVEKLFYDEFIELHRLASDYITKVKDYRKNKK